MGLRRLARRSVAAALISVVVFTTLGGVAGPPAAKAAFPGATGRIAWQRLDNNGYHIWSMRSDGSDQQDLGQGLYPSWSPDGSKIAFTSSSGLTVMDADGSNRDLIGGDGSWPTWSPDGLKIAFAKFDNAISNWDIWVMNADGTGQVNLTNLPSEEIAPSWSPDGTKVAYQSNASGPQSVWVMNADGSNPTDLTPGPTGANSPDWSPDGTKIVYTGAGIWTMNANGSGKLMIEPDGGVQPNWSPDGSRIVFADSGRDFDWEIYSMAANGTGLLRLTTTSVFENVAEDMEPAWQPTAFALSDDSLAFATGVVGTPTAAKTVVFKAGADPVSVTSVVVGGTNAAEFQKTANSCSGVVVAAMATCSVSVRFAATSAAIKAATLTFTGPDPLGAEVVQLSGTGRLFLWSTIKAAGPSYTFNYGRSLASTTSGSTTYLHGIYTGIRVGSSWVTDSGPYAGVYYIRSSNHGSTWTTAKRLNPTTQHGSRVAVASSGSYVYTAWISTTKWVKYSGTAPRVLYFKRNTSNGSSSAWSTTVRLTPTAGRVDAPTIAASGSYVYVTWTDSVTGSIRVAISSNRGATWKQVTVGTTTFTAGTSGKSGLPAVSAYGPTVAVAYAADPTLTVRARVASAYGATWKPTVVIGSTNSSPDVSVHGNRVGVSRSMAGGVILRIATAGVWGSDIGLPATDTYGSEQQYAPAIALYGTNGIGVAYTACIVDCDHSSASAITRSDMVWRESVNNGVSWAPSDILGTSTASSRRQNDSPSIVWKSSKRPYVMWNGWTEETNYFKLYIRSGA